MKYSNSILDALERINEKLGGRMDDAGTITEALDQIGDSIEAGGPAAVIDPTLTMKSQAAEAKTTGDRLTDIRAAVGSPLKASTASAMTDTDKIYVYTGSETGYTFGDWYYYDRANEEWTDGGVYNSIAVETDTTLTVSGGVADAKATGDEISDLKSKTLIYITSPTLPEGVELYNNNYVYKYGHVVMLHISLKINTSATSLTIGDYIPEGCRPRFQETVVCDTSLGDGKEQPVKLKPDGTIQIWPVNKDKVTYATSTVMYLAWP